MGDIRVEVVPADGAFGQDLAGPPAPELFAARAGEIADSVAEVAAQFRARIDKDIGTDEAEGWNVSQVEVTFGLQVEVGAGVLIAKASAGATFTATLTWTR
jgi:NTP-dependent ternary system trypsin peptidase co-occuring protein